MEKENMSWLMKVSKSIFPIFLGITITLLVEVIAGDLVWYSGNSVPIGWFALWLLSTVLSITIGVVSMVLANWRNNPDYEFGKTSMGYLLIGLFNLLALTLHISSVRVFPEGSWWVVLGYGILVFGSWAIIQKKENNKEKIFP